jgi:hypothetical protein
LNDQRFHVLSRSILVVHRLAGPLTVATWLAVCGGFALEVVPRHDAVERLYQMGAARDALARARLADHLRRPMSHSTSESPAETSSDVASGR